MGIKVGMGKDYPIGALARAQYEQAKDHLKRGEYEKAEELFKHMRESDVRVLKRKYGADANRNVLQSSNDTTR